MRSTQISSLITKYLPFYNDIFFAADCAFAPVNQVKSDMFCLILKRAEKGNKVSTNQLGNRTPKWTFQPRNIAHTNLIRQVGFCFPNFSDLSDSLAIVPITTSKIICVS